LSTPQRCHGWMPVTWAFFALVAMPCQALDITLVYDENQSDNPATDPNGNQLGSIVEAAASIWDDLIVPNHALTITYRWADLSDETVSKSGQTINEVFDENGRIISATLQFNKEREFWIDPTPLDHSEFDIQQFLYRDLDPEQQANWYSAAPDLLEVGYAGDPKSENTQDINGRTLGESTRDLLTLVLHEMGHTLNVNSTPGGVGREEIELEIGDEFSDYDFDPTSVGGFTVAAFTQRSEPDPDDPNGPLELRDHIHPTLDEDGNEIANPLSPVLNWGKSLGSPYMRRLPSATDVLAIQSAAGWAIDLNRQDWLFPGTGAWTTLFSGWEGRGIPDHAAIRNGFDVILTSKGAHVESLMVAEGSDVHVLDHELIVNDNLQVDPTSQLTLSGGTVTGNFLVGGEIRGFGTMFLGFGSSVIESGDPSGKIVATSGQTLEIDGFSPLTIDPTIEAIEGDIRIANSSTIRGDLVVGPSRTAYIKTMFVLDGGSVLLDGGTIHLDGTDTLVLQDGNLTVEGSTNINGRVNLHPDSQTDVETGGFLQIMDVAEMFGGSLTLSEFSSATFAKLTTISGGIIYMPDNAQMIFDGPVEFAGGAIHGDGDLRHNDNVLISDDLTIFVDDFDMDGSAEVPNHFFTVASGADFVLNANRIESTDFVDGYDGTFIVSGMATINTASPWRMDGELRFTNNSQSPVLDGNTVQIDGSVRLSPNTTAQIFSPVTFNGASVIIDAGEVLNLRNDTVYRGGSYLGPGRLSQIGDATIQQDTTIFVQTYDIDGIGGNTTVTVTDGVTFSIESEAIETSIVQSFGGTLEIAGELHVDILGPSWVMGGVLNFDDGLVSGDKVIVTGEVNGNGIFDVDIDNGGGWNPGNSPGLIEVTGHYHQLPEGTLNMEIVGLLPGVDHDLLMLNGGATLGGELRLVFRDGFAPQLGQTFDLLQVMGPVASSFDEVTVVNLADGFQFHVGFTSAGTYRLTALNDGVFVPEPNSAVLRTSVLLALFLRKRRSREENVTGPNGTVADC